MAQITYLPMFGLLITLSVWLVADYIYRKAHNNPIVHPVMLSVTIIIAILLVSDTKFENYNEGGKMLSFLLGPAVVALAVPLYRNIESIKNNLLAIVSGVFIGSLTGIISATGLVLLLKGTTQIALSISPKSVTTPIAIGISEKVGGVPSLTVAIVIITGILGAMFGPELLRFIGIRNKIAIGLAIGTASHGIGTSRAFELDEKAGTISGIGMALNGVTTALILPYVINLLV